MVRAGWTSSLVTDAQLLEEEQRRAWRELPVGDRLAYIRELSVMAYSVKGIGPEDGERLSRLDTRAQ